MMDEPRIVERDGDVVRILAGNIEVMAEITRSGNTIVLDRASLDGAGPGSVGLAKLRSLARAFAINEGVTQLIIRGTHRTTGAKPGKFPREIVIKV